MPVTLINPDSGVEKSCIEPAGLAKSCRAIGLDTSWFGLANSYTCPLGLEPGEGWLLMRKKDLDEFLPDDGPPPVPDDYPPGPYTTPPYPPYISPTYVNVRFQSADATGRVDTATLKRLLILGATCVTPGARGGDGKADDDACYLVRLADRRHFFQALVANSSRMPGRLANYNVRHLRYGNYVLATLRPGTPPLGPQVPWTWSEVVQDLWENADPPRGSGSNPREPTGFMGDYPGLPYAPLGVPENLAFWGKNVAEALATVFARLSMYFAWDPIRDRFRVVEGGAGDSAFDAALAALDGRRVWDDYPRRDYAARLPTAASVLVRQATAYKNAVGSPYPYVVGRTVDNLDYTYPPDPGASGVPARMQTRSLLHNQFLYGVALTGAGSPTLPVSNQPEWSEQAAKYLQNLRARSKPLRVVYPFALSDVALMPGPMVDSVRWAETGLTVTPHTGLTTEVRRGHLPIPKPSFPSHDVDLEPPNAYVLQVTSSTPDPFGNYPAVLTLFEGAAEAWTGRVDTVTIKCRGLNGETLTAKRYLGTFQAVNSRGEVIWAVAAAP